VWVFTGTGFVSIVASGNEADTLVVRSRDRLSLEPIAELAGAEIVVGAGTDYPYRVFVERATLASWLAEQTAAIDYRNFKDRVHDTRGDRFADALFRVWSAMCNVTDDEATGQG
jgi:hypothetical protein